MHLLPYWDDSHKIRKVTRKNSCISADTHVTGVHASKCPLKQGFLSGLGGLGWLTKYKTVTKEFSETIQEKNG